MAVTFATEKTLGKLSKWLRILGFDTRSEADGEDLAAAGETGRIVLTRTRRRLERLGRERCLFIGSNNPFDQLKEVIGALGLKPDDVRLFTRCLICNDPTEPIEKNAVCDRVPDYVWESCNRFWQCRRCRKIYWSGSHRQRAGQKIADLFAGGRQDRSNHGAGS